MVTHFLFTTSWFCFRLLTCFRIFLSMFDASFTLLVYCLSSASDVAHCLSFVLFYFGGSCTLQLCGHLAHGILFLTMIWGGAKGLVSIPHEFEERGGDESEEGGPGYHRTCVDSNHLLAGSQLMSLIGDDFKLLGRSRVGSIPLLGLSLCRPGVEVTWTHHICFSLLFTP